MREEVRQYKRTRIIEEASRLFYENGYEATSVDVLASNLSVTKPFIYSYFPNKLAILEAVYERSTERLVGHITNELERKGSPADRLRDFVILFVTENITHQISSAIFLQEEKHLSASQLKRIHEIEHSFNKLLAELIQAGIDAGMFHITDAKLASLSISGMVRWVHRWYRPEGRLTATEVAEGMAELGLNLVGFKEQ
jgi:AcrR family transcriptional regulator